MLTIIFNTAYICFVNCFHSSCQTLYVHPVCVHVSVSAGHVDEDVSCCQGSNKASKRRTHWKC